MDDLENINSEITQLYSTDQKDRERKFDDEERMERMAANDIPRLRRAHELFTLLERSEITLTPESLYLLAMLFQHSPDSADYLLAQKLAERAGEAGYEKGKWLSAAAEDRYLLSIGKQQKWGTQFRKNANREWEQFPFESDEDSDVTDAMRSERDIPSRREQLERFIAKQTAWENK